MLGWLKDLGDAVTHDGRAPETYEMLKQLAMEDDDEEEDAMSKARLIALLQSYVPSPKDLCPPFEKKQKPSQKSS